MPICKICGEKFPNRIIIDGKERNLSTRSFCIKCSPFGQHNTKDLTKPTTPGLYKCCMCKKLKPITDFYIRHNTNRNKSYCKKCDTKYNTIRGINAKLKAIKYKGGKCEKCGISGHYSIFDFHHKHNKDMGIAKLKLKKWDTIKEELDKCSLLCANCHRLEHYYTSVV